MASRNQTRLGLVAFCFALMFIGGVVEVPDSRPEYDITKNPFGTLPTDTIAGTPAGECDDFGAVGSPVDDDGDGVANEFDAHCIMLADIDSNGICDTRVWDGSMDENHGFGEYSQYIPAFPCTGWE